MANFCGFRVFAFFATFAATLKFRQALNAANFSHAHTNVCVYKYISHTVGVTSLVVATYGEKVSVYVYICIYMLALC